MSNQPAQIGTIVPNEDTRLGRMLAAGRLTATMLSKQTQQHVTLTMQAKKKDAEGWQSARLAEASHVFIKMGQGEYGATKLATYYPRSGKLYFDTQDRAWQYAIKETFRAAVTGAQETSVYAITEADRCGICGKVLTNPASIALGIGPDCEEKYMGTSHERTKHYTQMAENLVERTREVTQRPSSVPGNRPITIERTASAVTMYGGTRYAEGPRPATDKKGRAVPRTFEALAAAVNG